HTSRAVSNTSCAVFPDVAPLFSPRAWPADAPQANPQPSPAPRPLPDTARRVLVMAVVNRTRDSFFDEGGTWDLDAAVLAGREAAADGADIIAVGGVKFAPSEPLPVAAVIARVNPVIPAPREPLPGVVLRSVGPLHAAVAQAAIEVGVDLINDTTGLSDPEMAPTVAAGGASIVLTHSLAEPRRQYLRPQYDDVVEEVRDYLA